MPRPFYWQCRHYHRGTI